MLSSSAFPALPLDVRGGLGLDTRQKGGVLFIDLRDVALPAKKISDTYFVTSPAGDLPLSDGMRVLVRIDQANSGAPKLSLDNGAPWAWCDVAGNPLTPGALAPDLLVEARYDEAKRIWVSNQLAGLTVAVFDAVLKVWFSNLPTALDGSDLLPLIGADPAGSGVYRLPKATADEVDAGTSNARYVTPATLKPVVDAKLDVDAKASAAEAGDKTVTGKWLDPAGAALTKELSQLKVVSASPAVPDWINRTTPYGPITFNLGGLPGACLPGGGTVAAFAAIQGLLDINTDGQNNLSTFAAGVSGIARARTSNPSPVGIFGGAMANTPDNVTAQVFGGNFVATNQRDFNPYTTSGVKRAEVYCIELDMETHPADDGSQPIINARGSWTTGNSRVQPTGEFTAHLVGPAGILRSPQVRWKKAFRSQEGASEIALEACQVNLTGSSPSQPIRYVSTHPDGTPRYATTSSDPTGGFFIQTNSYFVYADAAGNARWTWNNLGFYPGGDNVQDIGSSTAKIRNLYVGNSPIVGSDARLKTLRGDGGFTDAELDAWGDVEPKVYQMKAAIAEKGADKARLHAGYIAQEILAAFEAHGLDAFAYGLVCQEALTEEVEVKGRGTFKQPRYEAVTIEGENGEAVPVTRYRQVTDPETGEPAYDEVEMDTTTTETRPTGETQLSVRYDECQVWQAAWMRREIARLKA